MSSEELHVPRERPRDSTYSMHLAIDCDDAELKAGVIHNRDDEMEHAAMLLEWLRRNVPEFAAQLTKFLNVAGPIA